MGSVGGSRDRRAARGPEPRRRRGVLVGSSRRWAHVARGEASGCVAPDPRRGGRRVSGLRQRDEAPRWGRRVRWLRGADEVVVAPPISHPFAGCKSSPGGVHARRSSAATPASRVHRHARPSIARSTSGALPPTIDNCRPSSRGETGETTGPSRKVRTPQGKVVGRPTRGNPRESATETHRLSAGPHVSSVPARVKWCGKSAPAPRRRGGQANPTRCKAKQERRRCPPSSR